MNAMKSKSNAKLISVRQAESELGLPASLLRDLIRRGELRAIQPPGIRRVFLDRRDLDAALERWKIQE